MKTNKFFLRLFLIIAIGLTVLVDTVGIWGIVKLRNKVILTREIKVGVIHDKERGEIIEEATVDAIPFCIKILIAYNIAMLLVIIYDIKRLRVFSKLENHINQITTETEHEKE